MWRHWLAGLIAAWCGLALLVPFDELSASPEAAIITGTWIVMGLALVWMITSIALWRHSLRSGENHGLLRLAMPGSRLLAKATLASVALVIPACSTNGNAPVLQQVGVASSSTTTTPVTMVTTGEGTSAPTLVPESIQPSTTTIVVDSVATPSFPSTTTSTTNAPASDDTATPNKGDDGAAGGEIEANDIDTATNDSDLNDSGDAAALSTHTVQSGEHLWSIAQMILEASGTEPTTESTTPYWGELIQLNRATLRSGNPNLIFPGEVLQLPPIESADTRLSAETATASPSNRPNTPQ